jgi:hypothetical protein
LASQFVSDHRWFTPQTGNDGDVDTSALHSVEQRAEIPIAGKQHNVIDLICELKGVDSKFDTHAALELAASLAIVELFCRIRNHGKAIVGPVHQRADRGNIPKKKNPALARGNSF